MSDFYQVAKQATDLFCTFSDDKPAAVPRGEPCPECGSWERAASVQGGVVLEHGPGHGCFGCLAWRPTTSVRMYCGAHPERRLPNDAPTQAPSWCPLRQENGGVVTVRGRRGS